MKVSISEQERQLIEQMCIQAHAYLLDLVVKGSSSRPFLEVVIDSVDGVTHEMCRSISRSIDDLSETTPFLSAIAGFDVTSPGVDRPLQFPWQYKKHIGRELSTALTAGGKIEGVLLATSDDGITIVKKSKRRKKEENDTVEIFIPFKDINHTIVQLRWK